MDSVGLREGRGRAGWLSEGLSDSGQVVMVSQQMFIGYHTQCSRDNTEQNWTPLKGACHLTGKMGYDQNAGYKTQGQMEFSEGEKKDGR